MVTIKINADMYTLDIVLKKFVYVFSSPVDNIWKYNKYLFFFDKVFTYNSNNHTVLFRWNLSVTKYLHFALL